MAYVVGMCAAITACSPITMQILPPTSGDVTPAFACAKAAECKLVTDVSSCEACIALLLQQNPRLEEGLLNGDFKTSEVTCELLAKYGKSTRAFECIEGNWGNAK